MKRLNYIWLLLFISLFGACNDNELESFEPNGNEKAIISISCDDLLSVDMNTKAAQNLDAVLSKINDLNIRIHLKDGTNKDIYCTSKKLVVDGTDITLQTDAKVKYIDKHDINGLNLYHAVMLHCDDITQSQVDYVEVIANKKVDLHSTTDWSTIQEKVTDNNIVNGDYCLMYGRSNPTAAAIDHTHNDLTCRLFSVKLKRSRALMTFVINTAGLNNGVEITPKSVRLCNMPNACNLTSLVGSFDKDGNPVGANKIGSMDENSYSPIGSLALAREVHLDERKLTNDPNSCTYGAHELNGTLPGKFFPLYMFENMQGTNANATNADPTKYPAGIKNVAQAKDRNNNYKYSYIEIAAKYMYRDAGTVKVSGDITYRFFLGKNAKDNFDVEGNHYYKLTLNLKGFGGAKEDGKVDANGKLVVNDNDASWRVDMNTTDWGFEKSQYDFDSHFIEGSIDVIGTNWSFTKVEVGDGLASWLILNIERPKKGDLVNQDWANPTQIADKKNNVKLKIVNGKLRFNIQPMLFGSGRIDPEGYFDATTYKKTKNYREIKIQVTNNDTQQTQTVSVRQYAPIPVTIGSGENAETFFMERFEEYENDSQGNVVIGYPWKFYNNDLSQLHKESPYTSVSYIYDATSREQAGSNSLYLSPKYEGAFNINTNEWEYVLKYEKEGVGSAAHKAFDKGYCNPLQGASVSYYAIPSQNMMEAMFKMAATYDKSWGPFEPMHIYEDYWTSTVKSASKTQTVYYCGDNSYKNTSDKISTRKDLKRIRAVYTNQVGSAGGDD